jgi:hypothetical protein
VRDTPEQWYETPEWRTRECPNLKCLARVGELCVDTRFGTWDPDGAWRVYWRFPIEKPHRERLEREWEPMVGGADPDNGS